MLLSLVEPQQEQAIARRQIAIKVDGTVDLTVFPAQPRRA